MKTAYKFLRTGLLSNYDKSPWTLRLWRSVAPPTKECQGLNCSRNIVDALHYVKGEILAKVEYGGAVIDGGDKLTCEKMRILEAWKWDKRASVQLAIFAAREVLPLFETQYPQDPRPRAAIAAAEAWLENPTEWNRKKAKKAGAAAEAAWAATVNVAAAAAYAAAYAAYAAADAYAAATYAAATARKLLKRKLHRYVLSLLGELEKV